MFAKIFKARKNVFFFSFCIGVNGVFFKDAESYQQQYAKRFLKLDPDLRSLNMDPDRSNHRQRNQRIWNSFSKREPENG